LQYFQVQENLLISTFD